MEEGRDYSEELEFWRIQNAANDLLDSLFYGHGVLFDGYLQGKELAVIDRAISIAQEMIPFDESVSPRLRKQREELLTKRAGVIKNLEALKEQFSQ